MLNAIRKIGALDSLLKMIKLMVTAFFKLNNVIKKTTLNMIYMKKCLLCLNQKSYGQRVRARTQQISLQDLNHKKGAQNILTVTIYAFKVIGAQTFSIILQQECACQSQPDVKNKMVNMITTSQ